MNIGEFYEEHGIDFNAGAELQKLHNKHTLSKIKRNNIGSGKYGDVYHVEFDKSLIEQYKNLLGSSECDYAVKISNSEPEPSVCSGFKKGFVRCRCIVAYANAKHGKLCSAQFCPSSWPNELVREYMFLKIVKNYSPDATPDVYGVYVGKKKESIMMMTKYTKSLSTFLREANDYDNADELNENLDILTNIIHQILIYLDDISPLEIMHNDLHPGNIMLEPVNDGTMYKGLLLKTTKKFKVPLQNGEFKVLYSKDFKYIVKIIDYGFAAKYSYPMIFHPFLQPDCDHESVLYTYTNVYDIVYFIHSIYYMFDHYNTAKTNPAGNLLKKIFGLSDFDDVDKAQKAWKESKNKKILSAEWQEYAENSFARKNYLYHFNNKIWITINVTTKEKPNYRGAMNMNIFDMIEKNLDICDLLQIQ